MVAPALPVIDGRVERLRGMRVTIYRSLLFAVVGLRRRLFTVSALRCAHAEMPHIRMQCAHNSFVN
jgi:hypothetical protein